jgi:hypothetical protein
MVGKDLGILLLSVMCLELAAYGQQPGARDGQPITNLGADASGNPLRRALKTGHISNYDESKVRPYALPDPLVQIGGRRVADATAWRTRRAEIVRLYETEIYGRVPANAPKVKWQVREIDRGALDGTAVMKHVVGSMGNAPDRQPIHLTVYTPEKAAGPVPLILMVNVGGGPAAARARGAAVPPRATFNAGAEVLARGWGYATVGYQDIQPDRPDSWTQGVIGLTLPAGHLQPAPDEWGTISAWAWGISRIVDYLETDGLVNAKQIAVQGHSRLGKTVLWAAAKDERIAAVFSSCAGEMGSALARRDWGETVDDMAQNFGWQFAGNFQKWVGRWDDMPVDAHMLIALSAPRPVFVSGGTTDQWSDPVGEFLAAVAAGPVYRLLGRNDLGVTQLPPLDAPVIGGDLGWHYHTGGHVATPADWSAFLQFLGKYFV